MATVNRMGSKKFRSVSPGHAVGCLRADELFKRQRGRRATNLKGLVFQKRYCVLTSKKLEYYQNKPKDVGQKSKETYRTYPVSKIKMVEKVPDMTFRRSFCFQIGNEKEVMYFSATSEKDRDAWIDTFRVAAFELGRNQKLTYYHAGAYGQMEKNCWSCCNKVGRGAEGCERSTCLSIHERTPTQELFTSDKEEPDRAKVCSNSAPTYTGLHFDSTPESGDSYGESDFDLEEDEPGVLQQAHGSRPKRLLQHHKSFESLDSGTGISICTNADNASFRAPLQQSTPSQSGSTRFNHLKKFQSSVQQFPFVYSCDANKIKLEGESTYATTVLFKGADSVIITTNNGKVYFASTINANSPPRQFSLAENGGVINSVSAWGDYVAFASEDIQVVQLGSLDRAAKGGKFLESYHQGSSKLVAFCPDGSLFYASKRRNNIYKWTKPVMNWEFSDSHPKLDGTFKVGEDGDQIFSITVSPRQTWLAVGVLSSKEPHIDHVQVYNYEKGLVLHHSFEIGPKSDVKVAFTHDGRYLFVGSDLRLQCYNMKAMKEPEFSHTFKNDSSITTLACSPVRHHLAVGLKTGEVKVFAGDSSQKMLVNSFTTDEKNNSPVMSLSYSRDGMKTAVTFQNGPVEIWKLGLKSPKEPAFVRTGSVIVTSKGRTINMVEDGCSIVIPEGAVEKDTTVTLNYGVAPYSPYGPFEFEIGARPVSAIVSLYPEPADYKFIKPIKITLPHFLACETQEDCKRLSFGKSHHQNCTVKGSRKVYFFKQIEDGKIVHFCGYDRKSKTLQGAATLYTQHCCYLCILENYSEEETSKALFSLQQIVPRNRNYSEENRVYYSLSYHLQTCIKTVDEQFPDEFYEKNKKVVRFQTTGQAQEALRIEFKPTLSNLSGDWALQPIEKQQIAQQDVCFWSNVEIMANIEELCKSKEYPPKITLRVVPGELVTKGVYTTVSFSGVHHAFNQSGPIEFFLELTKPQHNPLSAQRSNNLSTSSSCSSTRDQVLFSSKMKKEDFQERFDDIAKNVPCKELASALYAESTTKKHPYLQSDKKALEKIRAFLRMGRHTQTENFPVNFEILCDALDIADKHEGYLSAIQAALNRVGQYLYTRDDHQTSHSERHPEEYSSAASMNTDESLPTSESGTGFINSNSYPGHDSLPGHTDGYDTQMQREDPQSFNPPYEPSESMADIETN